MTVPETPCDVPIRAVCPKCQRVVQVELEVVTALHVKDTIEETSSQLKVSARVRDKIEHLCDQMSISEVE